MANTTVEISEEARDFAARKAVERGLATPGAYLERLVDRAKRRERVGHKLQRTLTEGMDSSPSEPITPEDWDAMRQALRESLAARHKD